MKLKLAKIALKTALYLLGMELPKIKVGIEDLIKHLEDVPNK